MTVYLKNATYIDWETLEFTAGDIKVDSGESGFSFVDDIPLKVDTDSDFQVIDCAGKYVTKSFTCGHHHIYSALSRGMPAPARAPESFRDILELIWWNLDKNLDADLIRLSALVTAIYSLKAGSTFIIDHHSSPFAVPGSLSVIAESLESAGLGHLLCYEISDRDGEESRENGLAETREYLSRNQGLVGLHASFTVGDSLLEKASALCRDLNAGIHVHVAEGPEDQIDSKNIYKKRVIHRYHDAGLLSSSKSILVHCLDLDETEWKILSESSAWVVQNSESNLNNGVGLFKAPEDFHRVMLGTDGMHSDMLRAMKAAYFTSQLAGGIGMDEIYRRFRNVHRYLALNGFRGDGDNNLVILDYDAPTEMNSTNVLGHLIFGIESRHVDTVISRGEVVMRGGEAVKLDEQEVLDEAKAAASVLWSRMQQ